MWQGLAILFGLSFFILILITLLTRPEKKDKLSAFYERCKPMGWWGPVKSETSGLKINKRIVTNSALGIGSALGLVLFTNSLFAGELFILISGLLLAIIPGWILVRRLSHN